MEEIRRDWDQEQGVCLQAQGGILPCLREEDKEMLRIILSVAISTQILFLAFLQL